jgi:hypothetical protein
MAKDMVTILGMVISTAEMMVIILDKSWSDNENLFFTDLYVEHGKDDVYMGYGRGDGEGFGTGRGIGYGEGTSAGCGSGRGIGHGYNI